MSWYYDNDVALPASKIDKDLQPTIPSNQKLVSSEFNAIRQILIDSKQALIQARYFAFNRAATAPLSLAGYTNLRSNLGILEVSDNGGAYTPIGDSSSLGAPAIKRNGLWTAVNSMASRVLTTTVTATASRIYWTPFTLATAQVISKVGAINTATNVCDMSMGVYGNTSTAGGDAPGSLLGSASVHSTSSSLKEFAFSLALEAHTIYWLSLICSITMPFFCVNEYEVPHNLGTTIAAGVVASVTPYTHLYAAGSGYALPATAPAVTPGTGTVPALFLYRD